MRFPRIKTLFLLISAFGLSSELHAYTSQDYYNAGLTLYQQKNYAQAQRYFDAAVQIDPTNLTALQGQANCYYFNGQYAAALADYQKIQTAHPTDGMAQFIQGLQVKVNASNTVASSTDPMAQGQSLYQAKQYQAAAPYFQQAIQNAPNDYKTYYWSALDSLMMGDRKAAVLNFTLSDRKQPNPSVKDYVQKLWATLNPPEQQWVYDQLARLTAPSEAPQPSSKPGIRLEPFATFPSMGDFNAQGVAGKAYFGQLLNSNPSLVYTALVPSAYINVSVEPVFPLLPNLELGVPLSYLPIGSFNESLSTNAGSSTASQNFSAFSAGLNLRYFITPGNVRLFVAGGPLVADVSDSLTQPSGNQTFLASLGGLGVGGQLQLGLDWHFDSVVLTPVVGYQFLTVNSLTGTVSGVTGQVTEMYNANSGAGYSLLYITSDPSSLPSGWRPVQVDLSGPFCGLSAAIYF